MGNLTDYFITNTSSLLCHNLRVITAGTFISSISVDADIFTWTTSVTFIDICNVSNSVYSYNVQ